VFVVLTLLHVALLARAGSRGLVRSNVPRVRYLGLLAGYGVGAFVLFAAMLIASWSPITALVVVGVSIVLGPLGARRSDTFVHRATQAPRGKPARRPPTRGRGGPPAGDT
jgi:hypothetical protein